MFAFVQSPNSYYLYLTIQSFMFAFDFYVIQDKSLINSVLTPKLMMITVPNLGSIRGTGN
jgi:hypothetical protein